MFAAISSTSSALIWVITSYTTLVYVFSYYKNKLQWTIILSNFRTIARKKFTTEAISMVKFSS